MAKHAFTLFDSPIGRCGIAWSEHGLVGVQLPEKHDGETRARLLRQHPDAVALPAPAPVAEAVDAIAALLRGSGGDLTDINLDMARIPPFHRRVYAVARTIAPGSTLSYGAIAARLDTPGAARAVGQALGRNPFAIVVPCHRVLTASGRIGGFSAGGGIATKLRLLALEAPPAQRSLALDTDDDALLFDPIQAIAHLRSADPQLAALIDAVGPFRMRVDTTQSLFIALAEAIVYQQLNGKAAATIFARLRALFPRPHEAPTAAQILRTSDAKLRGAGLSQSKLLALRDLAERSAVGVLPDLNGVRAMDDATAIEQLTAVRGIGRWTVEMLLMLRLGRPDILPVDDYGVRKGFAVIFNNGAMPTPKQLEHYGERWRPYRSVASWYLWRAFDPQP